ncbi:hypothetical protein HK104_000297 [Borealophlyctis nickersoniae]|nr:hypothetical protein HK104_000297 [Borealophlyctis nickersoniae]
MPLSFALAHLMTTARGGDNKTDIPRYHSHWSRVESLWIATFTMLFLWALSLILFFVACALYYGLPYLRRARDHYALTRGREDAGGGPSGILPRIEERLADVAERVAETEGPGGRVGTTEGGVDLIEEPYARGSGWLTRLDRASQAARTGTLLLLTLATLASLPIEYHCPRVPTLFLQKPPIPIPCTTCLTNAATMPYAWYFLELFSTTTRSSALARLLVTGLGQPLVAAAFLIALVRWNRVKGVECPK